MTDLSLVVSKFRDIRMPRLWYALRVTTGREGCAQRDAVGGIRSKVTAPTHRQRSAASVHPTPVALVRSPSVEIASSESLVCLVPQIEMTRGCRNGKKRWLRPALPGWLIVGFVDGLDDRQWLRLMAQPHVIGFAGGDRPMRIPAAEISVLLDACRGQFTPPFKLPSVASGDHVEVQVGFAAGLPGKVKFVDGDNLTVSIHIFGRETLATLGLAKIRKIGYPA